MPGADEVQAPGADGAALRRIEHDHAQVGGRGPIVVTDTGHGMNEVTRTWEGSRGSYRNPS